MKLALALACLPVVAHADDFVTLDRQSPTSSAGVEMGYLFPHEDTASNSETVARLDVHGEYVDPRLGLGVYVNTAIADLSAHIGASGEFQKAVDWGGTGVGNLEIGPIYVLRMPDPRVRIVFHGGVMVPTASTDDGNAEFANAQASVMRVQDLYLTVRATVFRVGMSPMIRAGNVFLRFDLGYDHTTIYDNTPDTLDLIHLDAGAGVDLAGVQLMAELVPVRAVHGPALSGALMDTGAVSVRLKRGWFQPYVALQLPLDDVSQQIETAALIVGVDAVLR